MRTNYAVVLGCALLLSTVAPAQKIIDKDISFSYIRLPKEPLGRQYGNYQSYVVAAYAADNAKMKADWEKQKGEADAQYQMDLALWSQKDKAAQDKFDKEMDVYNKKSTAQKMLDKNLLNEGKPIRQVIPEPYKNVPPEPKYKKEYDSNLLSSYLKLDGFKNSPENAVIITVTLYGFEGIPPQMKSEQKNVKDDKGVAKTVTMYHYETSYKNPMSVKVECPGKGVVLNQSIEAFNNYTVEKTAESEQPPQSMNSEQKMKDLEQSSLTANLKFINDLVNEKFGYCKATRGTVLYCSESKKADYTDLKTAFDNALSAYNTLLDDKAAAVAKLNTAIGIWLKAVGEVSSAKKARITPEVGAMMELNLAEAFMWMDNYPEAETHMTKVSMMDPSRKMKRHGEEVAAMIKIQKSLFNANK